MLIQKLTLASQWYVTSLHQWVYGCCLNCFYQTAFFSSSQSTTHPPTFLPVLSYSYLSLHLAIPSFYTSVSPDPPSLPPSFPPPFSLSLISSQLAPLDLSALLSESFLLKARSLVWSERKMDEAEPVLHGVRCVWKQVLSPLSSCTKISSQWLVLKPGSILYLCAGIFCWELWSLAHGFLPVLCNFLALQTIP